MRDRLKHTIFQVQEFVLSARPEEEFPAIANGDQALGQPASSRQSPGESSVGVSVMEVFVSRFGQHRRLILPLTHATRRSF